MTQTKFEKAFAYTHQNEGGFVDHPDDPGGATKHGVSLRWLRSLGRLDLNGDGLAEGDLDGDGDIDLNDMKLLTKEKVKALFQVHFWERYGFERLPPLIGVKVFDLVVNMGPRPAFRILQRACRANGFALVDDGILGPKTESQTAALYHRNASALLAAISSEAAGFYRGLIVKNPAFKAFERGWLRRAYLRPPL